MRRIDTSTAAQDLFGPGKHGFRDGDPANAVLATQLNAAYFNSVQEELAQLVECSGLELSPVDNGQIVRAIRGGDATLSGSASLTAAHAGLLHLDAAGGTRMFTLPPAASAKTSHDFLLRRVDSSGHRLVVQASGAEKIQFHTHLSAVGYPFFVLMGAGDWWRLRSDGTTWWLVGRLDSTPLGRPVFETTTLFSPGGYGALNGPLLSRADWPWLWDHAQQSGMLTTESGRIGREGGWTSGDGVATFRGPEGRGEFLRILDDSRGADTSRLAGSFQYGSLGIGEIVDAVGSFRRMQNLKTKFFDESNASDTVATAQAASSASSIQSAASQYIGATRPRNIAYPGRIKLI